MANKITFTDKDYRVDMEESASEDEYTEREKFLVKKYKNSKRKPDPESEEEVMGFGSDEEEDDDDGLDDFLDGDEKERFENDSDIISENDDDIPDARAWGKDKSSFYNTNYVDQDYGTYTEREEESAAQEEKEARSIQLQLAKHLNEADFSLDVFMDETAEVESAVAKQKESSGIKLKTDLSDLSLKQKQQLLKKDSPEFQGLVKEFDAKLEESYNELEPILIELKKHNIPDEHPVIKFIQLKNELILTYCTNISVYLLFKASKQPIKNHPLLKRLVQVRELLLKLDEKYNSSVRPEVERLLEDTQNGRNIIFITPEKEEPKPILKSKKKLSILRKMEVSEKPEETGLFDNEDDFEDDEEGRKIEKEMQSMLDKLKEDGDEDELEDGEDDQKSNEEDEEMVDEKRKITYQMSKNKGLTPHRKKELRNPRVKHRMKYRKALIRRKGAVRTVKKEEKRYAGEHSGIKSTVRKGIKIN